MIAPGPDEGKHGVAPQRHGGTADRHPAGGQTDAGATVRRPPEPAGAGPCHGASRNDHAFVRRFIMLPDFGLAAVEPGWHHMSIGIGSGPRREPVPQPPSPPGS